MIYKLASRDNIYSEKFESWPAVLNLAFTKFNNTVATHIFSSEDDVLNWLESKCRTKSSNRYTNVQEFRNGDPNKLYSMYACDHDNPNHGPELQDRFMYSLRIRRSHEAYMTFTNEKGSRVKSSFKKIDKKVEYGLSAVDGNDIDHSSEPRIVNGSYFEGIFPLDDDDSDILHKRYMEYVKNIHDADTEENKAKDYAVVYVEKSHGQRWLDTFVKKLDHVEKYLEFFAAGGNSYVNIEKDPDHDEMLSYIFKLLDDHRQDTPEDDLLQTRVRNMMIDPFLSSSEIFQVRYDRTLMTWHRNYIYMIKKLNIVPSKCFSDMILNFSLMDFYKQIHNKTNLENMIKNLEGIYGINCMPTQQPITYVKGRSAFPNDRSKSKFHKVIRSFAN